ANEPPVDIVPVFEDPVRGLLTLQVRASGARALEGMYTLVFPGGASGRDVIAPIYLALSVASGAGRNLREKLEHVAAMSGGAFVHDLHQPDVLAYKLPAGWAVTLLLCLLLVVLFSPLARPWTAFRLWLRMRRDHRLEVSAPPLANMDAESLLSEVGAHPGLVVARRVAGMPGGVKTYETGDSLSVALASSLHPFTKLGRDLGLPQRLPRVRLRVAVNPMLATILVDDSPGLNVPDRSRFPSKADFVRLIANLVASTVWSQAGLVRVRFLRQPDFGGSEVAISADSGELDALLRRCLQPGRARGRRARLPEQEEGEPNQVIFLLTDGLNHRISQMQRWIEHRAQEGTRVRVALLLHPLDERFLGLCRDAESRVLLDRSEWTAGDLALAQVRRVEEMRRACEANEGRFISVSTDIPLTTLIDRLVEEGFLG